MNSSICSIKRYIDNLASSTQSYMLKTHKRIDKSFKVTLFNIV